MKQEQKFETIITSFVNGNISWSKSEVKKLSKGNRKKLYQYLLDQGLSDNTNEFFFELI